MWKLRQEDDSAAGSLVISLNVGKEDSKVKPESLLTLEEVKAIVAEAENERDRTLLQMFFEGAFRPGESY